MTGSRRSSEVGDVRGRAGKMLGPRTFGLAEVLAADVRAWARSRPLRPDAVQILVSMMSGQSRRLMMCQVLRAAVDGTRRARA